MPVRPPSALRGMGIGGREATHIIITMPSYPVLLCPEFDVGCVDPELDELIDQLDGLDRHENLPAYPRGAESPQARGVYRFQT